MSQTMVNFRGYTIQFFSILGILTFFGLTSIGPVYIFTIIAVLFLRLLTSKTSILLLSLLFSAYLGNFGQLVTKGHPDRPQYAHTLIQSLTNHFSENHFFYNLLAIIATVLASGLLIGALKKLRLSHLNRLLIFVLISFLWIYFISVYSKNPDSIGIVVLSTVFYSKIFVLLMLILSTKHFEIKGLKNILQIFPPIWDTSAAGRPGLIIPESQKNPKLLIKETWEIVRLFVVFSTIALVLKVLFTSNPIWNTSFTPIFSFNLSSTINLENEYAWYINWITLFALGCAHIFNYLAWSCSIDICYRLMGFETPRQFFYPFDSKTGGEFYSKIMPYYSHALTVMFIYPIYKWLSSKIKNKSTRYTVALFLGQIIFANIFHIIIDIDYFLKYEFYNVIVNQTLSLIPFNILLFLMLRYASIPNSTRRVQLFIRPAFFAMLILVIGAISIFRFQPMKISVAQKLVYFQTALNPFHTKK